MKTSLKNLRIYATHVLSKAYPLTLWMVRSNLVRVPLNVTVSFSSNRRPLRPPILAPWRRPTMLLQLDRLRTAGIQLSSSRFRTAGSQPNRSQPRTTESQPNSSLPRTAGSRPDSCRPRTAGSQPNSSRPRTAGSWPNNSHCRHNQNQRRWWLRNRGSRSRQLKLLGRHHSPGVCTQVFSLTGAFESGFRLRIRIWENADTSLFNGIMLVGWQSMNP